MNQQNIARNIKTLRRHCGLTQAQVAEKIGVTTAHISHIEIGRVAVSLPLLIKMCKLMHVTPNDILTGEYIPEKSGSETSDFHEEGAYAKGISLKNLNPDDRMVLDSVYEFMKKRKRES